MTKKSSLEHFWDKVIIDTPQGGNLTKLGMKNNQPRKPMKQVSDKMADQLAKERLLTAQLIIKQNGKCAKCGRSIVVNGKLAFGAAKHEKVFRSHGGDPLDIDNCEILCYTDHNLAHGIKIVEE